MKLQIILTVSISILLFSLTDCTIWSQIEMIKPIQDSREYFTSTLPNGLEILLISDKESLISHTGLSVGVGSFQDPNTLSGLAHFLEHMLFMGSIPYPDVSAFNDCVSLHQGSTNAQTENTFTSFYMDIAEDGLLPCLQIFSQFFVSPLLDSNYVEKEVNAVDSEYQNQLSSQANAKYAAFKLMTDIQHPIHKFTCGNKDTLWNNPRSNKVDVVEQLKHFHNQYYSSNIMKLVIISGQDIETLQKKVEDMFSKVEDKKIDRSALNKKQPIFKGHNQIVRLKSKEKHKQLSIIFEIDWNLHDFYKKSVEIVLEHISHNGPESFQRYLKNNNFITEISTSLLEQTDEQCVIEIEMNLTENGYFKRQQILDQMFSYLKQLQEQDWNNHEYVYNQMKKTNEQMFRVNENNENTVGLAQAMFYYPMDQLLYYQYNFTSFDTEQIKSVLTQMNKSQAQIILSNDEFNFDKLIKLRGNDSHKYFDDTYKINYQKQDMHLAINDTIPVSFTISNKMLQYIPKEDIQEYHDVPKIAYENTGVKLWHLEVNQLKVQQHTVHLMIYSSEMFKTAVDNTKGQLLEKYFHEMIQDQFYNLNALYSIELSASLEGISIMFQGNSEYLNQIVIDFFTKLHANYSITEDKFQMIKNDFIQEQSNDLKEDCYQQAESRMKTLLYKYYYDGQSILDSVLDISLSDLMIFKERMLSHIYVESLIAGQISKESSIELIEKVESLLNITDAMNTKTVFRLIDQQITDIRGRSLQVSQFNHNPSDNNECYMQYRQLDKESIVSTTIWGLIASYVEDSSFQYLRTEQQLGYIVSAQPLASQGVQGLSVLIQGSQYSSEQMSRESGNWYGLVVKQIQEMSDDKMNQLKHSFKQILMQKDNELSSIAEKYWNHIMNRDYLFNKKYYVLQCLQEVTREHIIRELSQMNKGTVEVSVRVHNHEEKFSKEKREVDSDLKGLKDKQWPVYKQFLDQNSFQFRFMQRLKKNLDRKVRRD